MRTNTLKVGPVTGAGCAAREASSDHLHWLGRP